MRDQITSLLTALGEAATAVQERRHRRRDLRTEEWNERFDARHWAHITGELPTVQQAP